MLQNELQRYIFKIHSEKLRNAKWNLTLPLAEARKNGEVISLAGSQMLRWIDELNGDTDSDERARKVRSEIRYIRSKENTPQNKRRVRQLYDELDSIQFKPDYISVVIDKTSDYKRMCKGFSINGIEYKRLLGTAGGIKMSTIVFVSARLHGELTRRIDNGRNPNKNFNPSKLEAYRALTCSASYPVSFPEGIVVVNDCETEFYADVIHLANSEGDVEPVMSKPVRDLVKIDACDGFGLILPSLAERWSEEMGLDYRIAGCCCRNAFTKGMLYTFDFLDFAEKVGGTYVIKDAWGFDVDIRNVEMVLTVSMLKLCDSYGSCDEYIKKTKANHYTFGITKTTPKELENERSLNYQFIQSYKLSDDDIEKLCELSMEEITGVLGGDWKKTLLFLRGSGMNPENVVAADNNYIKALMINPEIINDQYVQSCVYRQIKNRINEMKTGVLKVHGNYSIASGDPYTLCQSMFGLELTGLLKAGELYNKYWVDSGSEYVVCFRAPMSVHSNIRKMKPTSSDEIAYWYQYMDTCTIFNSWDTTMPSMNGMDFDGDLVMITDNEVLVRNHREMPALICSQSSASKIIPTEDDMINSNIAGFGNDIGKITNRITSMYELQAQFDEDSIQYKELEYRICCGQLQQQDCIDKIKGIISKPMPREWYDPHYLSGIEDPVERKLYSDILAFRKPYFMRYIYPTMSRKYSTYEKKSNRNCLRYFGISLKDLLNKNADELSEEELEFLNRYNYSLPLGTGRCVMNVICKLFEDRFDSVSDRRITGVFDYNMFKSGADYTESQYKTIKGLYENYNQRLQSYVTFQKYEKVDSTDAAISVQFLRNEFLAECVKVCPNKDALCDIVLDVTYRSECSKGFAWDMCGDEIIENIYNKFGHKLSFPILDESGDIYYCGNRYSLCDVDLEEVDYEYIVE